MSTAEIHYQTTYTLAYAAKWVGMKQNSFFEQLRKDGLLCKDNLPIQQYINRGIFKIHRSRYEVRGITRHRMSAQVTEDGLEWLFKRYNPEENNDGLSTPDASAPTQPSTAAATANPIHGSDCAQQSATHSKR